MIKISKIKRNISIDPEIEAQLQLQKVNVSGIINEFLKNYLATPENNDSDEKKLREDIDDIENDINKLTYNLTSLRIQLQKRLEQQNKERKEYIEKGVAMVHAMNNAGIGRE